MQELLPEERRGRGGKEERTNLFPSTTKPPRKEERSVSRSFLVHKTTEDGGEA